MIPRCISTFVLLLLAFYAFWGNALDVGRFFNPFGILFLFLAYVTWFKWRIVAGAFGSVKDESNIPILRMGYKVIQGFETKTSRDELSAERSSGDK
ncbi:MAG TPA: hypothetical protein VGI28_09095 [Stellaceae bacterium]|jgi:hypothetical protein